MKENLEVLLLIVSIVTPITIGVWFIWKKRQATILENYKTLAQVWTNEGAIISKETKFITLKLSLENGELYGTLESPRFERDFEAHVYPGWFSSKLEISELIGNHIIPKAIIKIKIKGNRNRLKWKAQKLIDVDLLPKSTVLWAWNNRKTI
ncbi:MAG: hypothetical protein WC209_00985 [Ignavibacteriaceae bacterium]|jgi:hypothetical protein